MENSKSHSRHSSSSKHPEKNPKAQIRLELNSSSNSKSRASPDQPLSSTRPCREHSFLTDVADVRSMEQGLLQLLDDFHSGKLQAFGRDCTFDQMDQVREQQEKLARLHFDMDSTQEMKEGMDTSTEKEVVNKNLRTLMDKLRELCTSIQDLQRTEPPRADQQRGNPPH